MLTWAQLLLKLLTLLSRLLSFLKIQKAKREGREEVVSEIKKQEERVENELKKLRDTDTSFDAAIDGLRDRSRRRKNAVYRN